MGCGASSSARPSQSVVDPVSFENKRKSSEGPSNRSSNKVSAPEERRPSSSAASYPAGARDAANGAVGPPPASVPASKGSSRPPSASAADSKAPSASSTAQQAAAPALTLPSDPWADDPLATTRIGITLRGLRRLQSHLMATLGVEHFERLSTSELNEEWVEVVTLPRRCRLLAMKDLVDPADVAPPMYFISHSWKNRACRLFAYVLNYLQDASESVAVWLDILSVNQHEDTLAHRRDVHPDAFSGTVRACGAGTIVVLDREVCSPATRGWCIFEWAHTLALHGPDGLLLHLNPEDRRAVLDSIDVERAECFKASDKEMILGQVVQHYGSPAAFNAKLRLQILLQPLSFSLDVRRLAQRASGLRGATWRLDPIRRWIAGEKIPPPPPPASPAAAAADGGRPVAADSEPPGPRTAADADTGAGRLLVVSAGAGEGKSTVSALLVSQQYDTAGGKAGVETAPPAAVHAHVFLKYSDARRLEPLRVVATLAFQLAERFPAVCDYLLSLDVKEVDGLRDLGAAVDLLLRRPLEQLGTGPRAAPGNALGPGGVVLLLDALDEADPIEQQLAQGGVGGSGGGADGSTSAGVALTPKALGNGVLALLTQHLSRLPPFVRFLVTTRPEAASGQVLPALIGSFGRPPASSSNESALQAGPSELDRGVTVIRPAELALKAETASSRPGVTGGNGSGGGGVSGGDGGDHTGGMLVYHTVAAAVAAAARAPAGRIPLPPLTAPPTLDDVYRLYGSIFDASERLSSLASLVADLVAVVVAAREPLSHSFVQQLGLGDAIPHLPGAPTLFFLEEHRLYLLHKSLADWLTDPRVSGGFAARIGAGHRLLGLHLARQWRQRQEASRKAQQKQVQDEGGSEGDAKPAAATETMGTDTSTSLYLLRYAVTHLAAAADWEAAASGGTAPKAALPSGDPRATGALSAAANALDELLSDFVFVHAVLHSGNGFAVIAALGGMRHCPPYAYDILCWFRGNLASLEGLTLEQLLVRALQAPPATRLYGAAVRETKQPWRTVSLMSRLGDGWPDCGAVMRGHSRTIHTLAFSPDGRQLASGGEDTGQDAGPRIWDVDTGRCNAHLPSPGGVEVTCAVFTEDGRQLLSGCGKQVCIYDVATGHLTATLKGSASQIRALAVASPRVTAAGGGGVLGPLIAVGSEDGSLHLWHLRSGALLATLTAAERGHSSEITCVDLAAVALLPVPVPAQAPAAGSVASAAAAIAEAAPGGERAVAGCGTSQLLLASASKGKTLLRPGEAQGNLKVWELVLECRDTEAPRPLTGEHEHEQEIFSEKGAASHQVHLTARHQVTLTARCIYSLGGHTIACDICAWGPAAPTGTVRLMASAGSDPVVRLWAVPLPALPSSGSGGRPGSGGGVGGPHGGSLAAATCLAHLPVPGDGSLDCLAFFPLLHDDCGRRVQDQPAPLPESHEQEQAKQMLTLAYGTAVGDVHVLSLDAGLLLQRALSGEQTATATTTAGSVTGAASLLATGAAATVVRQVRRVHGHWVAAVTFSPDGSSLASCSFNEVRVWPSGISTSASGGPASSTSTTSSSSSSSSSSGDGGLPGHANGIRSVAISPDGRLLASAGKDRVILLWRYPDGALAGRLEEKMVLIDALAFSPAPFGADELQLASAGLAKEVRVWTLRLASGADGNTAAVTVPLAAAGSTVSGGSGGGEALTVINSEALKGHDDNVHCVAWFHDGRRLVSGGGDGTVRVWDMAGGRRAGEERAAGMVLRGHQKLVTAVCVAADGSRIISSGRDPKIRVWDVDSGNCIAELGDHPEWAAFMACAGPGPQCSPLLVVCGSYTVHEPHLRVWDVAEGRCVGDFRPHLEHLQGLAMSADARMIVAVNVNEPDDDLPPASRFLVLTAGSPTGPWSVTDLHGPDDTQAVAVSPDGTWFASVGSEDKAVRIWARV